MIQEIGSEFWNTAPACSSTAYLLSGRTALDFIIRDLLRSKPIRSAMLPGYCCHTMIAPFAANGIRVRFYDVYFDPERGLCADIPAAIDNELFYHITYFGFSTLNGVDPDYIRRTYAAVIDDRTHSWLCGQPMAQCDYAFESYRKWAGFCGLAKAVKQAGDFMSRPTQTNEAYVALRQKAFALKQQYIDAGQGDKQAFLTLFGEAEALLESDYRDYAAPDGCFRRFADIDWTQVAQVRRNNAAVLMAALRDVPGIRLMFDHLDDGDVPLFVPILATRRDALRSYLIDCQIYCPVHWPISGDHRGISPRAECLYGDTLSLVCDQRYTAADMKRIASVIGTFYENEGIL